MNFTIETFKAAYPELFAEIEAAAYQRGLDEGLKKGKSEGETSGAEAERKRIRDVEGQIIAGHEELIIQLKYDGKTTGAEAAVQVLNAERKLRETKLKNFQTDKSAQSVSGADPGDGSSDKSVTAKDKREAGEKIHELAKELQTKEGIGYSVAYQRIMKEQPKLANLYLGRPTE